MIIANSIYDNIPADLQRKIYNAGFIDMNHRQSKTKAETLFDRVSLLGCGIFNPVEWQLTGAEFCPTRTSCICGQAGLKHRYVLTNKTTGYSISVGGNCLLDHFNIDPPTELIDFSKKSESSEPYIWLGTKYDAFIFSALGFKKANKYFCLRKHGQSVPKEYNHILVKHLAISLYAYNSKKWQDKYDRGLRLLSKIRSAKYHNGINISSTVKKPDDQQQTFEGLISGITKRLNGLITQFKVSRTEERVELIEVIEKAILEEREKFSLSIYHHKEVNRTMISALLTDFERELVSLRGLVIQGLRPKEGKQQLSLSEGDISILSRNIDNAQNATKESKHESIKTAVEKYYKVKEAMKRLGISTSPDSKSKFGKLMRPLEGMMPALINELHQIEAQIAKEHKKESPVDKMLPIVKIIADERKPKKERPKKKAPVTVRATNGTADNKPTKPVQVKTAEDAVAKLGDFFSNRAIK